MQHFATVARVAPATQAPRAPDRSRFWSRHGAWPLCTFLALAALLAFSDLDRRLSLAWAFDTATGSFPARHAHWAEDVLHRGGRNFIWFIVLLCGSLLVAGIRRRSLRVWRRPLVYSILAIGTSTATIGALKRITQVHCPWELREFGGTAHYVSLFAERVGQSAAGGCFPAAHAGSGFALFALYFAVRDRKPGWSPIALALASSVGATFSFAQEARGAHFLSHDLWSAAIAWFICLALYRLLLWPSGHDQQ